MSREREPRSGAFEDCEEMDIAFSEDDKVLVKKQLQTILSSEQFVNARTVRAFLEFVVNETLDGRSERLKAYTIAVEALGRSPNFDSSGDTIVRTTAGRVRKALQAYYRADETEPEVVITLPKGGYVPSFVIRDKNPAPEVIEPEAVCDRQPPRFRADRWLAGMLLAALALSLLAIYSWKGNAASGSGNLVIRVRPVEDTTEQAQLLARQIDTRLAPALARLRLAEIIPPGAERNTGTGEPGQIDDADDIVFTLMGSIIAGGSGQELLWKLIEANSNHIVWTSRHQLAEADATSFDALVDKIAFQILGVGGGVSSAFERYRANSFAPPVCLLRAQIMEAVEDDHLYPKLRDCLERIVSVSPGDASAWAILSGFYIYRSHFYAAGSFEERDRLVERAEQAAERAVELAPENYLTKVALMHLALRQGRLDEFDVLQKEIRREYPGDIYLHIRIATRLARLDQGREALQIFDRARREFGINLKNWAPGIAVAYFSEGNYENAYRQMQRTTSDLRFVLVLKAAILAKLGRTDEAARQIRHLVETNPDITERFYDWLTDIGWAESVVLDIADGLAKGGLVVETPASNQPLPDRQQAAHAPPESDAVETK